MQSCHRKVNLLRTLELCIQNKQPYVPFDIEELKSINTLTALNVFPTDTGTTPWGWNTVAIITVDDWYEFVNNTFPINLPILGTFGIMVNQSKTGFYIYIKDE
jgi:hypothetical protein